jgi:hypothetical protein
MYLDDTPRLRRRTLQTAGALVPGRKTFWQWTGVAGPLSIEVTGHSGAFEMRDLGDGTWSRVVLAARHMVYPNCGCRCHLLVFGKGWGCCRCCGLKYRTRSCPQHPMIALRSVLRRLARANAGSLSEQKLQRKLEDINGMIGRSASRVAFRCTRPVR